MKETRVSIPNEILKTTVFLATMYAIYTDNLPFMPQNKVDLGSLPQKAPQSVSSQIGNAVLVRVKKESKKGDRKGYHIDWNSESYTQGSGVRIAPNTYLTAGHVLYEKKQTYETSIQACVDSSIGSVTTRITGAIPFQHGTTIPVRGIEYKAARQVGTYTPQNEGADDIALVQTDVEEFADPPQVKIREDPPKIGEKVFAVNYQPTAKNEYRTPNEGELNIRMLSLGYGKPAIYGGVILSTDEKNKYVMATNLKSYGVVNDSESREGSSGGAVYDTKGQLIGISISASDGKYNSDDMNWLWGLKIHGQDKDKKMSYTLVQPVTETHIGAMLMRIYQRQSCRPTLGLYP